MGTKTGLGVLCKSAAGTVDSSEIEASKVCMRAVVANVAIARMLMIVCCFLLVF
jgi:hypothetical protein